MDRLTEAGCAVPLYMLAEEDDDPEVWHSNIGIVRAAVHGLERRGLVFTFRATDDRRMIDTTSTIVTIGEGFRPATFREPNTRAWHGTWVRLRGSESALDEIEVIDG